MTREKPEPFHILATPGDILAVECETLEIATKLCAEKITKLKTLGGQGSYKVVEAPYPFPEGGRKVTS